MIRYYVARYIIRLPCVFDKICIANRYLNRSYTNYNSMIQICSRSIQWRRRSRSERQHKKCNYMSSNHSIIVWIYENSYKQCPKCGAIIEKNEGCNHMSCTNCNYEFCWICMEKYADEHYSLYNFFGCPGMKYSIEYF